MRLRAPRPPLTLVLAVANIGRGAPVARVLDSIERVEREARKRGAVIAFAEIDEDDEADEHAIIRRHFTEARGWQVVFPNGREPVAVPVRHWVIGQRRSFLALGGVARYSPARHIFDVTLICRSTGVKVGIVAGHYPTGARNSGPGDVARPTLARLRVGWWAMRRIHVARHVAYRVRGIDSGYAMDVNDPRWARINRSEVRAVSAAPDYIGAIPGRGRRASVLDTWRVDLTVDTHDVWIAAIRFADKPTKPRARLFRSKETR